jgi:glycosyltransferase involved in cell wall biosynthesis
MSSGKELKQMKNKSKVKDLKVALVHDFLTTDGGAERVLRVLHDIWPASDVFTTVYFPDEFDPPLKNWSIKTSFVDNFPFQKLLKHQYKIFYQMAMEQFDFDKYDLVISNTFAGYAKGVIVNPGVLHLCYIHNVPRFLWGLPTSLHGTLNPIYEKLILPPLEHWWRIWDRQTSDRPDKLLANSQNIQNRVQKFYRKDSTVLYPPVNVKQFLKAGHRYLNASAKSDSKSKDDYFVYFGRLEKYKNVDMAIRACQNAGEKLKIIGKGNARESLEELVDRLRAQDLVEFCGRVSDQKLKQIVAKAKAFIFPCPDEDFGIVPVESMALSTPVIAFDSGGVRETVVNGKTGILIDEFSQEKLNDAVKGFDLHRFKAKDCQKRAKEFSVQNFKDNLMSIIAQNLR